MKYLRLSILGYLYALSLLGCDSSSPTKPEGVQVSGKILLANGSPVPGGILVLRPVAGLHGASAPIGKDGSFQLSDPSGSRTVVPGKYQVFVRLNGTEQKTLKATINARYQSSEDGDSDVIVDIQAAQSDLNIRLKP